MKRYIQNIQSGDKRREIFSLLIFKLKGMQKILKQVVGIDVAQKELVVSLGRIYEDFTLEIYAYQIFPNSIKGLVPSASITDL